MRHAMAGKGFYLNLTSMVDMFCIILIFLLVSYSVTDVALSPPKDLILPQSFSRQVPNLAIKVVISNQEIMVEDHSVVRLAQGRLKEEDVQGLVIFPLYRELKTISDAKTAEEKEHPERKAERRIILQGDRSIPFETLKRVLFTAGQAEFEGFRFTVMQKGAAITQ